MASGSYADRHVFSIISKFKAMILEVWDNLEEFEIFTDWHCNGRCMNCLRGVSVAALVFERRYRSATAGNMMESTDTDLLDAIKVTAA